MKLLNRLNVVATTLISELRRHRWTTVSLRSAWLEGSLVYVVSSRPAKAEY